MPLLGATLQVGKHLGAAKRIRQPVVADVQYTRDAAISPFLDMSGLIRKNISLQGTPSISSMTLDNISASDLAI
jgi:hypothetical protein